MPSLIFRINTLGTELYDDKAEVTFNLPLNNHLPPLSNFRLKYVHINASVFSGRRGTMWMGVRFPQLENNLIQGENEASDFGNVIRFHVNHKPRAATDSLDVNLNRVIPQTNDNSHHTSNHVVDLPLGTHTIQERFVTAVLSFRDYRGTNPTEDSQYPNHIRNALIILEYN